MIELVVCILVSFLFLAFGSYKKDFPSLLFSSIAFILSGLMMVIKTSTGSFGNLLIFFGIYIGLRSSIELITQSFNIAGGVTIWQNSKRKK